ncbi:MAG: hypothetical protein AAF609_15190 [Cyanobacteria bacterium P01_C01_bin.120]
MVETAAADIVKSPQLQGREGFRLKPQPHRTDAIGSSQGFVFQPIGEHMAGADALVRKQLDLTTGDSLL